MVVSLKRGKMERHTSRMSPLAKNRCRVGQIEEEEEEEEEFTFSQPPQHAYLSALTLRHPSPSFQSLSPSAAHHDAQQNSRWHPGILQCNITGDYQVKWQHSANLPGLTGRLQVGRFQLWKVTFGGGRSGGKPAVFPLSLMSLSTPVNSSEAVRSCIICEVEPWGWCTVRYTYRAENDSHIGAGEPHFSRHYLAWFNDSGGDKGRQTEHMGEERVERQRVKI